jgi:hypothetical protein
MRWIFKSFTNDFLRLYFPGLLAFACLVFIQQGLKLNIEVKSGAELSTPWIVLIFNFIIFSMIDIGHTYTTMLKTYFDKEERKFSRMVWLTPVVVVAMLVLWRYFFDFRWFWVFLAYYTLFHNQRQGFGVMKWYESLNKKVYPITKIWFYILTFLPVIIYHFRSTISLFGVYYPGKVNLIEIPLNRIHVDFLGYNLVFSNQYHLVLMGLWFMAVNGWLLWELSNYLESKKIEWNRILAMLYFGGIYSYGFLVSNSYIATFTLLVASHGIPYMFMLNKRMVNLPGHQSKGLKWLKMLPLMIIALALIGGSFDAYNKLVLLNGSGGDVAQIFLEPTPWQLLLIILYVAPPICHYIWDSYLWKKGHPDSKHFYQA